MDYSPLIEIGLMDLEIRVAITQVKPMDHGNCMVLFRIGVSDWGREEAVLVTPEMLAEHPLTINHDNIRLAAIARIVRMTARRKLLGIKE